MNWYSVHRQGAICPWRWICLSEPVQIRCQTPILPPAMLLGNQPRPAQVVQGPLDRGAGQTHFSGNRPDSWPALAFAVGVILQVHIDRSGPVAQLGPINFIKISQIRYTSFPVFISGRSAASRHGCLAWAIRLLSAGVDAGTGGALAAGGCA